jgi:anaerobic selenocysteine-containing dehydrogenase
VPSRNGAGPGLELLVYRPLFSGPGVERIEPLAFQRPAPEIELAHADAQARGIATGDAVTLGANGSSRALRASVSRKLRPGVARIAAEHARGLGSHVEVTKA